MYTHWFSDATLLVLMRLGNLKLKTEGATGT